MRKPKKGDLQERIANGAPRARWIMLILHAPLIVNQYPQVHRPWEEAVCHLLLG